MQTWRGTELLQMLEVTTTVSHSHVGSKALGEVRHRLVDVAALPDGLQGDFNSSVVLGFSLWYFSSMVHQM